MQHPEDMLRIMLRRVLLALLTLCLALPAALPAGAAALPAPASTMAMAMPSHQHHHPADSSNRESEHQAGKHDCIGCAAPIDRQPFAAQALQMRGPQTRPGLAASLPESRAGPEVPPPRA